MPLASAMINGTHTTPITMHLEDQTRFPGRFAAMERLDAAREIIDAFSPVGQRRPILGHEVDHRQIDRSDIVSAIECMGPIIGLGDRNP